MKPLPIWYSVGKGGFCCWNKSNWAGASVGRTLLMKSPLFSPIWLTTTPIGLSGCWYMIDGPDDGGLKKGGRRTLTAPPRFPKLPFELPIWCSITWVGCCAKMSSGFEDVGFVNCWMGAGVTVLKLLIGLWKKSGLVCCWKTLNTLDGDVLM